MNIDDVEFGDRMSTGVEKIPNLAAERQRLGIPATQDATPDDAKRPFRIEFKLAGKEGTWPGVVCSATDEHEAIQTFMGNYARCMGTIVAIRVLKDAPELSAPINELLLRAG